MRERNNQHDFKIRHSYQNFKSYLCVSAMIANILIYKPIESKQRRCCVFTHIMSAAFILISILYLMLLYFLT